MIKYAKENRNQWRKSMKTESERGRKKTESWMRRYEMMMGRNEKMKEENIAKGRER